MAAGTVRRGQIAEACAVASAEDLVLRPVLGYLRCWLEGAQRLGLTGRVTRPVSWCSRLHWIPIQRRLADLKG